jgi:tetratricopeptide (TPR) repeat protein
MTNQGFFKEKTGTFLAGMGSALVMVLAFFIPSLQDQWDRYQTREVVEQYEQIGEEFFTEEKYNLAEQAFAKAYELSENRRIDIEIKRLNAKVNIISNNPNWGSKPPADLEDADFQFLVHFLKGNDNDKKRAAVLNSYGVFLAESGRLKEARKAFDDALNTNAADELIYINLGNLLDQQGKKQEAEKMYLKAISIDNENERAHYNLGLLFLEEDQLEAAKQEFVKAMALDPEDKDAKIQYDLFNVNSNENERAY